MRSVSFIWMSSSLETAQGEECSWPVANCVLAANQEEHGTSLEAPSETNRDTDRCTRAVERLARIAQAHVVDLRT